jgi:hypothetical protein
MPSSDRLVAIAAHGLAGSRTDLPAVPLSDVEWFDLVQACRAADLVGFLTTSAAERHLPTTPGQGDELAALGAEVAGITLVVERRAATMAAVLTAAAIDHRVVDGPARRLAYAGAAVRHFLSVRLLVARSRLNDARALLGPPPLPVGGRPVERRERLSLLASLPGLGAGIDGAHGATTPDGPGSAPGDDASRLPGAAVRLGIGDRTVQVLPLEQQLVATCVELSQSPVAALVDVRDVAELALSPGLDGAAARRLAEANQVTADLAQGVALAWRSFDLADKTELSVWALRMASRHQAAPPVRPTVPAARVGLAQRVFGRSTPSPAPAPVGSLQATPASATASVPTGIARPAGFTRR